MSRDDLRSMSDWGDGINSVPKQEPAEVAYRCRSCGRWSSSTVKPDSHRRFVSEGDGIPADAEVLTRVEPIVRTLTADGDWGGYGGGWFIACGPFDAYEVRPVGVR